MPRELVYFVEDIMPEMSGTLRRTSVVRKNDTIILDGGKYRLIKEVVRKKFGHNIVILLITDEKNFFEIFTNARVFLRRT